MKTWFVRLAETAELASEVAHKFGFPSDFKSALDRIAAIVNILKSSCNYVHVVVGVDAARDAEAYEVVATEAVFASDRVAVGENVANFASADTCFEVELAGQCLCGELFLWDVGEHLVGINKDGVSTSRALVRNAIFIKFVGKVLNLFDTGFNHFKLDVFFQANSESVHIAAVHAAISEEAFEWDAEEFGTFVPFFLFCSDETTHVDKAVFLGAHSHRVGVGEHFESDFAESFILITFFASLDEVGVLDEAGTIDVDRDTVFVAEFASFADVLHGNGLTSNGVVGYGEYHEWHIAFVFLEHFLEFFKAYVAFEGDFELSVVSFGDGDIDGEGLAALDVALGGVEVGVAGDHLAGLDEVGEQHVLGCAALVGGDDVLEAGELGDGVLHVVERAGAAVAFVTHHHSAPLAVAHGASTRVGEQVDVDIIALKHKDVLVSFFEPFLAFGTSGFLNGFDHLDFP